MAEDACIFCGTHPVTREDVVPKWLGDRLNEAPLYLGPKPRRLGQVRGSLGGPKNMWPSEKVAVIARCVCGRCNNGWMNDVEDEASSVFGSLWTGRMAILGPSKIQSIAVWATLKSVLFRYTSSPVKPVDRRWLSALYTERAPPRAGCFVWLSGYKGRQPFFYEATESFHAQPGRPIVKGFVTTMAFGNTVVQVLLVHQGEPRNLDPTGAVRVWPLPRDAVTWPLGFGYDDEALRLIANRFVR